MSWSGLRVILPLISLQPAQLREGGSTITRRKLFGGTVALAVGVTSAAILWLAQYDLCENVMIDMVASPDDLWQAVAFERNCGATTSTSINISLITMRDFPRGSGNIFVSSGNGVKLAWDDSSTLDVVYDPADRVFLANKDYSGVAIRYSLRPI
jgi:hypothetical protein